MNTFLRTLVTDALNPTLALLSDTLLTTPDPRGIPRLAQLWDGSWQILLASYGLLVLVAGITLMAFETLQTRHSLREVAPRLLVGFLAGALSLTGAGMAIELANALSAAVLGAGIGETDGATALGELITSALTSSNGALYLLIIGLAVTGMVQAILITYIVRVAVTIILIAGAPIALMLHALPLTEGIARWWWRTFGACLAIQIVQSLTLITALRVLLTPGSGFGLFGDRIDNGYVTLLTLFALLYILYRIPFWLLSASRIGGGSSLVGSLVRSFIAYKTFGLLRGSRSSSGRGRRGPGGGGGQGGGGGPRPPSGPPDPYARTKTTAGGQLALPLEGLRRRRPRPGIPGPPPRQWRRPAWAGRQLALPLTEGDWPENRPQVGPDGQYRLPLAVTRTPPPPPAPPAAAVPRPSGRAGRQLALPLTDGDWPENRPVLGADGQYRLPINPRRTRPTTPPHPAAPVGPTAGRGRQLEFTFDPYARNRPLRGGQYPLPLEGVARRPRTTPPTPTTGRAATPPAATPRRGRQLALPLTPPRRPTPPPTPAPPTPPRAAPRTGRAQAAPAASRRPATPTRGRPATAASDAQPPAAPRGDPAPQSARRASPPPARRTRASPPNPDAANPPPANPPPAHTTTRATPQRRPRRRPRPPTGDDPT